MEQTQLNEMINKLRRAEQFEDFGIRILYIFFTMIIVRGVTDESNRPFYILLLISFVVGLGLLSWGWYTGEPLQKKISSLLEQHLMKKPWWGLGKFLFAAYMFIAFFQRDISQTVVWIIFGIVFVISEFFFYKRRKILKLLENKLITK